MKNPFFFLLILAGSLVISSCHHMYSDTYFAPTPIDNLRIAVLPYEVHTTGRIAEQLTEEEIQSIEANERVAFQTSMYHQMVNRLGRSHYTTNVQIQHFTETNQLIEKGGYLLDSISHLSAGELSTLLEVDAVIRSNVHKQIFLTDLEAYGIEMARSFFYIFGGYFPWYVSSRTGDVRVSSSIISSQNGTTLWAASRKLNTDWYRDSYETIERINYQMTKRMPL